MGRQIKKLKFVTKSKPPNIYLQRMIWAFPNCCAANLLHCTPADIDKCLICPSNQKSPCKKAQKAKRVKVYSPAGRKVIRAVVKCCASADLLVALCVNWYQQHMHCIISTFPSQQTNCFISSLKKLLVHNHLVLKISTKMIFENWLNEAVSLVWHLWD